MSVRIILIYGDVRTDLRTSDALSVEGIETFARIARENHEQAIAFASAIQATT
jgi:hypothetical protein